MKKLLVCYLGSLIFLCTSCSFEPPLKKINFSGEAQGTYYAVTYFDQEGRNFTMEIDSLLTAFDQTASLWVENSIISKVNTNEQAVELNSIFRELFAMSKEVYSKSEGAFDPTIGPLVNAWGFGFREKMEVSEQVVDSLLTLVGFEQVRIENNKIIKNDPRIQLDFNAIAQGYSVDLIGRFLEQKGIKNYLVDVGGEVLASGQKPDGNLWSVGIENPKDHAAYGEGLKAIVNLKDQAMATSGSYRKFYEKDGVRYSHTIDPKTGYPVKHSLLSVSVLAGDCATADAWATAFMVLGLDESRKILEKRNGLEAYFVYSSDDGLNSAYFTDGYKNILVEEME